MNYIWDLAIKAAHQGIQPESITFVPGENCSPYMELAFEQLNTSVLEQPIVAVNPYYRFCDVFKQFLHINFLGHDEIKRVFFDIIIHYLLFLDYHQGLSKYEYYGKFILNDMHSGVFGQKIKDSLAAFTTEERHTLATGMIALYRTSASVHLLKQILRKIFIGSMIYYRGEETQEILIYLGIKETEESRRKIQSLLALFLPLGFTTRLYWEQHFGIIGIQETMEIGNIVIY